MTREEWQQVVTLLENLGLRVVSVDVKREQLTVQIPPTRK